MKARSIGAAIFWIGCGYALASFGADSPAAPQSRTVCECETLHDTVTRNAQRLEEAEHDIRELEAWREFQSRTSQEHGVNDAVKFAELETTVHAHERVLWLFTAAIVAMFVEAAYRLFTKKKAAEEGNLE